MYYGVDVYIINVMHNNARTGIDSKCHICNMFVSSIGIIIPIAVLFDLLVDKNRKAHPKDKKTDWFYKNEEL